MAPEGQEGAGPRSPQAVAARAAPAAGAGTAPPRRCRASGGCYIQSPQRALLLGSLGIWRHFKRSAHHRVALDERNPGVL